jgi:hypothetical protein
MTSREVRLDPLGRVTDRTAHTPSSSFHVASPARTAGPVPASRASLAEHGAWRPPPIRQAAATL